MALRCLAVSPGRDRPSAHFTRVALRGSASSRAADWDSSELGSVPSLSISIKLKQTELATGQGGCGSPKGAERGMAGAPSKLYIVLIQTRVASSRRQVERRKSGDQRPRIPPLIGQRQPKLNLNYPGPFIRTGGNAVNCHGIELRDYM